MSRHLRLIENGLKYSFTTPKGWKLPLGWKTKEEYEKEELMRVIYSFSEQIKKSESFVINSNIPYSFDEISHLFNPSFEKEKIRSKLVLRFK